LFLSAQSISYPSVEEAEGGWWWAMGEETAELLVEVNPGPDADSGQIYEQASKLRRELLNLDVQDVIRPTADQAPEGTRGLEVAAVGALLVRAFRSVESLQAVIGKIREWLARDLKRSAKLSIGGDTLEMTGLSSEDQERLVRDWVERHAGSNA